MKIAIVQMLGKELGSYPQVIKQIEDNIQEAGNQNVDFIVFPECTYPCYLLGTDSKTLAEALSHTETIISRIASMAKHYQVYIALGIALPCEGKLYNAALVFNREGRIINHAYKSNMWHFDERWFTPGEHSSVFDTEFGRIGMMICADGRIPEIARKLRLKGAQLIIDPVNLAANAAAPEQLSNQQYEFILQARARENGVFILACDKCGVEADMVTFLGRSFVADPEGNMILQCSPDKEEIGICEVDLSKSCAIPYRRPELYSEIIKPTEQLEVYKKMNRSYKVSELALYTMVIRFQYDSLEEYLQKAIRYIQGGYLMYADFVVLPELRLPALLEEEQLVRLKAHIQGRQIVAAAGWEQTAGGLRRRAVILTSDKILGELASTHCPDHLEADEISVVDLTPACSAAAVFGNEVDIPEISRTAMLKGADILLCFDDGSDDWHIKMMKTRAAENKMFVVRSSSAAQPDCSLIINPDGGQVCTTFKSNEHSAVGYINTALSKFKSVVPGTNVVTGRKPNIYKEMTE
ncbi:MAG TPA: carbon-nitrogen hydrolase family protein [Clostridia bacterium]|nr:carbon-nitrogen hydrolase family protein [Clostridia bacterium]